MAEARYLYIMRSMTGSDSRIWLSFGLGLIMTFSFIQCSRSPSSSSRLSLPPLARGEAVSFLNDTLQRPIEEEETIMQKDSLLREALQLYREDSTGLDNIIWYGRRLAYLHRYRDAIGIYTQGIQLHPDAPELYRHRGHRYITLFLPDAAIADLEKAAELAKGRSRETEADGIPNKLNIPLSNLHFNIYYHLGLAYYLKADYPRAIQAWQSCMTWSDNPDLKVATTDWLYLAYVRSGDTASADAVLEGIHPDMEIIENDSYLERLLVYKGVREPVALTDPTLDPISFATQNYGLSCWYDFRQRPSEASAIRRMILSSGTWPAFGYIAAEADSARIRKRVR